MSEEEFKVQYINFSPDNDEATRIRLLASNLYYLAPNDSTVKITIEKEGSNIHSILEVQSAYLQILESDSSETLLDSLAFSQKKVISELNNWKNRRFNNLATEKTICSRRDGRSV